MCRLAGLLPNGPEHRTDARWLRSGYLQQTLERPWLAEIREQPAYRLLRRQLAGRPAVAEEVEQGGGGLGEGPPCSRSAGVDHCLLADDEAGQAEAVGR